MEIWTKYIFVVIVLFYLPAQISTQVRDRRYSSHPSKLNHQWISSGGPSVPASKKTIVDRILGEVFVGHVDGFPYCGGCGKPQPLKVDLLLIVLAMLGIDEPSKMVELSVRFLMSWNHCALRWNETKFDNISKIEVPRSVAVWTPDLTWIERPEKDFSWRTQARLTLNSEGQLELVGQAIIRHACPGMQFTMFPFDAHKCELTFVSLAHDGADMTVNVSMMTAADFENGTRSYTGRKSAAVDTGDSPEEVLDTEQWLVRLREDRLCVPDYFHFDEMNQSALGGSASSNKYAESTCMINFRRQPLYHMFSLFTPASIITLLTAFAFLIPPNEADAKIGFALTIMLQLLVFMMYMYERLPVASTQIPLMTQYFSWCIFIVALSVLMTVVIAYVGWLGDDLIPMPRFLDAFGLRFLGRLLVSEHLKVLRRWEVHVHHSDRVTAAPRAVRVDGLLGKFDETETETEAEAEAETAFSTAAKKESESECEKEKSEPVVVQMRKTPESAGIRAATSVAFASSSRADFARSISRVEAPVHSCEDDQASLIRARWALLSLVIDKLCFGLFLAAIVVCIVYHSVVGYLSWSAFVFD